VYPDQVGARQLPGPAARSASSDQQSELVRWGVPVGPIVLLTVPTPETGLPRSTPVAVAPHPDGWRLIAPYGAVQ
jgi:hypothetical protein